MRHERTLLWTTPIGRWGHAPPPNEGPLAQDGVVAAVYSASVSLQPPIHLFHSSSSRASPAGNIGAGSMSRILIIERDEETSTGFAELRAVVRSIGNEETAELRKRLSIATELCAGRAMCTVVQNCLA